MTEEKANNQWRLLDNLGKEITKALKAVESLKAHSMYEVTSLRDTHQSLVISKDLCNKLKSVMIERSTNVTFNELDGRR